MTDDELPAFLNERGRMLFKTLSNRAEPTEAEIPGLIMICYCIQHGAEEDRELMRWLDEYQLTRRTMRRKLKREAAAMSAPTFSRRKLSRKVPGAPIFARKEKSMTTETTETEEQKQKRILEEARVRLRSICGQLMTLVPPADLAGVLLVQSISIMHLESDSDVCAAWLRDLAASVEALGVEAVVSKHDLN